MSYAVVSKIVTTRQIPAVIVRLLTEDNNDDMWLNIMMFSIIKLILDTFKMTSWGIFFYLRMI